MQPTEEATVVLGRPETPTDLLLKCSVSAHPIPSLSWTRDGVPASGQQSITGFRCVLDQDVKNEASLHTLVLSTPVASLHPPPPLPLCVYLSESPSFPSSSLFFIPSPSLPPSFPLSLPTYVPLSLNFSSFLSLPLSCNHAVIA